MYVQKIALIFEGVRGVTEREGIHPAPFVFMKTTKQPNNKRRRDLGHYKNVASCDLKNIMWC